MRGLNLLLPPLLLALRSSHVRATSSLAAQMSSSAPVSYASDGRQAPLALPGLESSSDDAPKQVHVGGDGVTLDHLGPMVINGDGTVSRINNWQEMSEHEKATTMRIVTKRNRERIAALKEKEQAAQEAAKAEEAPEPQSREEL